MSSRRLAVVVTVERHEDPVLSRFAVPSADVPALAEVLGDAALGGFEVAFLRDPEIREVQEHIEGLFDGRDSDDCILFYFRGVMLTGPGGGLYLAASDTAMARPADTGLDVAQLAGLLQHSRAGQAVVLLDGRTGGPVDAGHHFRAARSAEWQSRVVIAATARLEPPTFAGLVADGVRGGAADRDRDGFIGIGELYEHLRERDPGVRQWVFGSGRQAYLSRVKRQGSDQMALIAQLASAAAGDDLSRAVEARATLRRMTTGEGRVAAAAAAALRRTSIRIAAPALNFGLVAPGTRQLTAEVAVQGPPLGAASAVSSDAEGLHARLEGGVLRVSWFPTVGRLQGVVTLDGPAGTARLEVSGEVSDDAEMATGEWGAGPRGGSPEERRGPFPPGAPAVEAPAVAAPAVEAPAFDAPVPAGGGGAVRSVSSPPLRPWPGPLSAGGSAQGEPVRAESAQGGSGGGPVSAGGPTPEGGWPASGGWPGSAAGGFGWASKSPVQPEPPAGEAVPAQEGTASGASVDSAGGASAAGSPGDDAVPTAAQNGERAVGDDGDSAPGDDGDSAPGEVASAREGSDAPEALVAAGGEPEAGRAAVPGPRRPADDWVAAAEPVELWPGENPEPASPWSPAAAAPASGDGAGPGVPRQGNSGNPWSTTPARIEHGASSAGSGGDVPPPPDAGVPSAPGRPIGSWPASETPASAPNEAEASATPGETGGRAASEPASGPPSAPPADPWTSAAMSGTGPSAGRPPADTPWQSAIPTSGAGDRPGSTPTSGGPVDPWSSTASTSGAGTGAWPDPAPTSGSGTAAWPGPAPTSGSGTAAWPGPAEQTDSWPTSGAPADAWPATTPAARPPEKAEPGWPAATSPAAAAWPASTDWPQPKTADPAWPQPKTADPAWPQPNTADPAWPQANTADPAWPQPQAPNTEWPPTKPPAAPPSYPDAGPPSRRRAGRIAAVLLVILLLAGGTYIGARLALGPDDDPAPPPADTAGQQSAPASEPPPATAAPPPAPVPASVARPAVVDTIRLGREPEGVAVSPDNTTAYIADQNSKDVHVVDLRSKDVSVVKVANTPRFLAVSADGSRLYVSMFENNFTGNGLAVIDTEKRSLVKTIRTGPRPFEPAVAPNGQIWVPIHNGARVEIYDPVSLTEAGRLSVPPNPHWVTFSPDGKVAYTANHESSQVSVVNAEDRVVTRNIKVGRSPHSIAVTPDGKTLIVTNYDIDTVEIFNTADMRRLQRVPVGREPQAVITSTDGKHAYVVNEGSDTVSVIDLGSRKVVSTVRVGDSPRVIAVSPDGKRLYVTDGRGRSVTVLRATAE